MVKITGAKRHSGRLKAMTNIERDVGGALYAGGQMIEIDAEISITEGSVSGKGHVPSRPGEPPNRDTGDLDNKIDTVLVEPLKVHVEATSDHALPLEVGTSKMAERPFLRPAAQKNRKNVTDLVAKAIRTAVRRHGGRAT